MVRCESQSEIPSFEDYPAVPPSTGVKGGFRANNSADARALSQPMVSVVTIVRNGAGTLSRTMDSVLSQNVRDIEYIVVDGDSTDGTLELLRANQNRLALWISEPDRGISDAFNKGIALSRGQIIGLINSDDWYEPGSILCVVEQMLKTGADIASGRLQYWNGDRRTYLVSSDYTQLRRGMTVGHPTVFVRRKLYQKIGLFRLDFRLTMDYEWLLRSAVAGAHCIMLDRCLANMQEGGVGDRRWRDSQREVARARALHVPGAGTALAMRMFVARRIFIGSVRRVLDALGLARLRHIYHRWLSPITITTNNNGRTR